jgi:ketosteroid isomerase-like protein
MTSSYIQSALGLLVAFAIAGCASSPKGGTRANHQSEVAQIEHRLQDIFDACAKKDMPRLDSYHLYGPAFTKFTSENPTRLDAEAARKGEHDGLMAISGLAMQADDLKIDVFDETAVAAFILNYSFKAGADTVQKKTRTTMVFVKDHGAWKIAHEHLSAIQPHP